MDTFKVGGVAAPYGLESIGPYQSLVGSQIWGMLT
jgi:hypothetical protein